MPDAKGNHLDLPPITLKANARVLHKPGAERLDAYPRLVYAPAQYKDKGICTEDNGTSVEEICKAFAVKPDVEAVASQFGTTAEHVADALKYATKAGAVEPANG